MGGGCMKDFFKKRKVLRTIHVFMAVVLLMTVVPVSAAVCQKANKDQKSASLYSASSTSDQQARYDEYVRNLQHYNLIGVEQTIDLTRVYEGENQLDFHQDMKTIKLDEDGNVTISLKGKLADQYGKNYVVDRHVLKIYTKHVGNGSWGQILLLKDDGAIDAILYDQLDSSSIYMAYDLGNLKYVIDIITTYFRVCAIDMDDNLTDLDTYIREAKGR